MKIKLKQELTKQWFKNLQEIICKNIEELEKNKIFFKSKKWLKNNNKNEGGGESRLLENGKIFATFEIAWIIGWKYHESQQKPLKPGSGEKNLGEAISELG